MAPGALHRSRWMAKAIYSLKIWLYRHQFKLTSREEFGLKNICMFFVSVYVKAWFLSTSAPKEPSQDLKFLKQLEEYKTQNEEVSRVSVKKFLGHQWYLSEELVALAFFDQTLPFNTKEKMVNALKKINFEHPIKRAVVNPNYIQYRKLEDFVSSNTFRFFEGIGLESTFLKKDPNEWFGDATYIVAKDIVEHILVVNDNAERGVSLITEYNRLHTCNEEEKQFLLQVVSNHRLHYPNCLKATLVD